MLDTYPNPINGQAPQPPFVAADHANDGKKHLLLAASGSVATIKIPNIVIALSKHTNLSIILLLTTPATSFLQAQSPEQPLLSSLLSSLHSPSVSHIFTDADEWACPWVRGNPILHIELRRWADIMVIAPLSANTLAKIVGGWSDNLLTSVVRAWDTSGLIERRKRILVAPAMNTMMWRHPVTGRQVAVLEGEWGVKEGEGGDGEEGWFEVLRPKEKELACGDVGDGAMREWSEIVEVIERRLGLGS
ncbi:phosphopantothenoylcysteine decarboxylase [Amylocarpus encephaloides]|uniref:Phosphopantothenoylcysteine decarboxylase n=1 Tax=Amylocarpus encephaloides TaxID=45428 RepID=A0A9P8C8L8_9HELO|nr:phosphopantothenoylcysteine decarboxylase [Amylocarpus encephaloides]